MLLHLCEIASIIFEVRQDLQSKNFARYYDTAYSFHVKVYTMQPINLAVHNPCFSVTQTMDSKYREKRQAI
jgi:hypothetical protein